MTGIREGVTLVVLAALPLGCATPRPHPRRPLPSKPPPPAARSPQMRTATPLAYYEYLLGELAWGRGDHRRAALRFRTALAEDPESPELRLRLAELALEKGDAEDSLRLVEKARAEDPAYPRSHLLAALLVRERDPKRAISLLRQVIALAPRQARAYLRLAPLERRVRGTGAEQAVYRALLRERPDHLEALLGLARSLRRDRRDEEAASRLRTAARVHPFAVEPWLELARLCVVEGRWRRAVRWLFDGLEATGDDPILAEELFRVWLAEGRHDRAKDLVVLLEGHEAPATQTLVANLRDRLGDARGAERALLGARQQDPSHGPAVVELARLWRRRGEAAKARRLLADVDRRAGSWVEAQRELAAQEEADGEWSQAEERLNALVGAQPRDGNALESLAFLQARIGRPDLALASLAKARRARRQLVDDPSHRYALALLLEESGEWARAERLALDRLESDPDDSQALNLVGYGLADRGIQLGRARRLLDRAWRLDPLNPYLQDSMGWIRYRQGRPREAIPFLERAVRLDRRLCEAWHHLGEARLAAGQRTLAEEAWVKALECDPGVSAVAVLRGRRRLLYGPSTRPREPWSPRARTRCYR